MHYASSQENGLYAEVRVWTLMKVYRYGPASQRTKTTTSLYLGCISAIGHWSTASQQYIGILGIQSISLWYGSDGKENYFHWLEATRHNPSKSLI